MTAQLPDRHDIQDAWNPVPLREQWPMGLDNYFIMKRLMEVPVEQTLIGARGRVLEVAAAEAVHVGDQLHLVLHDWGSVFTKHTATAAQASSTPLRRMTFSGRPPSRLS